MSKKLNFKGMSIEEICKILEGGINISVYEASDIMNAIERDVKLKRKDGFMPNSMWVEQMAQLDLFEFIQNEDGDISTKDVIYVDFNKSQKSTVKELKAKKKQVENDIAKLEERAKKLDNIEETVNDLNRQIDKTRKQLSRKRNQMSDKEIAKMENKLEKLRAERNELKSMAKSDVQTKLEYKMEQLENIKVDIKNQDADSLTDEVERNISGLKKDLYEGFSLKRTEYSESLKRDISRIDRKIAKAYEDGNEVMIAKLNEEKAQLLVDRADEITVYLDNYKVTMQSSSKSRLNKSIFIRDEIVNTKSGEVVKIRALEAIENKMTMGLSKKLHSDTEKIIPAVEYEAYSTLTQSSIVDGFIEIKGNNILVVKDVDCKVKTKAVVGTQSANKSDILLKKIEEYNDKNTLWDGLSLLDKSLFRNDHDMILLRQNYFKSAGFKCNLVDYIKIQCKEIGLDYENDFIKDAYGRKVRIKDIKMITTNNSTKFDKFAKEMFDGDDADRKMFEHWLDCLEKDWDNLFAIVKYDKSTKFKNGELVRASYQMFNTIPFGDDIEESMEKLVKVTQDYVDELMTNSTAFMDYLQNVANNEKSDWLLEMMKANADIVNTEEFKRERRAICNSILDNAKNGKLFVEGNNLTLCSNPVELVKYALGSPDVVVKDGILNKELTKNSFGKDSDDFINVYTNKFIQNEDLVFMRSPHSSASGICVGKNVKNEEIEQLFGKELGNNILIIDSTNHASQSMLNGAK